MGCKDKASSWHLIGFPDGSNIGSTVYYVQGGGAGGSNSHRIVSPGDVALGHALC